MPSQDQWWSVPHGWSLRSRQLATNILSLRPSHLPSRVSPRHRHRRLYDWPISSLLDDTDWLHGSALGHWRSAGNPRDLSTISPRTSLRAIAETD